VQIMKIVYMVQLVVKMVQISPNGAHGANSVVD